MDLDRWRLRLPESTQPELTSVFCKNGVLIVIVPKRANGEN
jgi:HSP20 family molecular chaperone IbpA